MQTCRPILLRLLSFVLAALVVVWAGAASAEEAYDSATELVEQAGVQFDHADVFSDGVDDPFDIPAVVSRFALPAVPAFAPWPESSRPVFASISPRPTSPPPRRA